MSVVKKILEEGNYELVAAIVGSSSQRKIPDFIRDGLDTDIFEVRSPNFITDKKNRGLDISRSIGFNLGLLPHFSSSLKEINSIIKRCRPDLVINFYEPLIGLYNFFYKNSGKKIIAIFHQINSYWQQFQARSVILSNGR